MAIKDPILFITVEEFKNSKYFNELSFDKVNTPDNEIWFAISVASSNIDYLSGFTISKKWPEITPTDFTDNIQTATTNYVRFLLTKDVDYLRGQGSISQGGLTYSETNPDDPYFIPPEVFNYLRKIKEYPNIKGFDLKGIEPQKNNDISQNELFKLDDNQFNWLSITNELETNNIPSLIPVDWTLGNGEYGKYFTRTIINNNKIENALNLYDSNKSQLLSKLEFYKEISKIDNNSEFELQIENPINNLNRIEISGIFGAGNYDLILITDKQEINLTNINLFDKYNENISYINLEI